MQLDAPFVLGPFTVDGEGRLRPRDAAAPPEFSLVWHDCQVWVRFEPDGAATAMVLHASPGRVPSTAPAGAGARASLFGTLALLPPLLPAGWRLRLLADHRLELAGPLALTLPATASALLAAVTSHLLACGPYLDLLGEAGVEPAGPVAEGGAAGGRVKICPG